MLNDKGLLEIQCQHASLHTHLGNRPASHTHTHITHTLGLQNDLSSYVSPTLVSIPSPESERPWSCWGGGGEQGLLEERERGPILEELLSGGGGQPKGRILVLESGRGEEG